MSTTRFLTTLKKCEKGGYSMELQLDFTGLNNIAHSTAIKDFTDVPEATEKAIEEPVEAREIPLDSFKALLGAVDKPTEDTQKPVEGIALIKLQREQEDHNRTLEAYRSYQDNIRRSGSLRTDILKGARAGDPVQLLFLKAVECIGCMTGDKLFTEQVKKDLKTIYGEGLLEPIPLEWELDEVKERLKRLEDAYNRAEIGTDDKAKIYKAIEAHRARANYLKGLIDKGIQIKNAV